MHNWFFFIELEMSSRVHHIDLAVLFTTTLVVILQYEPLFSVTLCKLGECMSEFLEAKQLETLIHWNWYCLNGKDILVFLVQSILKNVNDAFVSRLHLLTNTWIVFSFTVLVYSIMSFSFFFSYFWPDLLYLHYWTVLPVVLNEIWKLLQ